LGRVIPYRQEGRLCSPTPGLPQRGRGTAAAVDEESQLGKSAGFISKIFGFHSNVLQYVLAHRAKIIMDIFVFVS